MSEDLIKRSDAIKAIANLHVSHDREEIFKAYAKNPHSMTTDFEETLIDAINAVEAIPSADMPHSDDWERYSDRLWKKAYERGKAEAWRIAQIVFDSTVTLYEAEDVARTKGADDE